MSSASIRSNLESATFTVIPGADGRRGTCCSPNGLVRRAAVVDEANATADVEGE